MKRIFAMALCLAVILSFSAPVSARMLKSKYDVPPSLQGGAVERGGAYGSPYIKVPASEGRLTPTPARYAARVEEIQLNLDEYLSSTVESVLDPTSEAAQTRALNNFFFAHADAVAEIAAIKAPKEFAKASALYKTAAKHAATWSRLVRKAMASNKQSDIDRAIASVDKFTYSLHAAENEYYSVCDRLQISI